MEGRRAGEKVLPEEEGRALGGRRRSRAEGDNEVDGLGDDVDDEVDGRGAKRDADGEEEEENRAGLPVFGAGGALGGRRDVGDVGEAEYDGERRNQDQWG